MSVVKIAAVVRPPLGSSKLNRPGTREYSFRTLRPTDAILANAAGRIREPVPMPSCLCLAKIRVAWAL